MEAFMNAPKVDWTDRGSVVAFQLAGDRATGGRDFDEDEARARIEAVYDRTPPGADPGKAHRANQMGTVFAALDCGDRWRERLPGIAVPALVIHGEDDPFFPLGNAEALAAEIPDAELIVLPRTGRASRAARGTRSSPRSSATPPERRIP